MLGMLKRHSNSLCPLCKGRICWSEHTGIIGSTTTGYCMNHITRTKYFSSEPLCEFTCVVERVDECDGEIIYWFFPPQNEQLSFWDES